MPLPKVWWNSASCILISRFPKIVPRGQNALSKTTQIREEVHTNIISQSQTGGPGVEYDYQVMLLKRSSRSKFMPHAYVFPGGKTDEEDGMKSWLDLFHNILPKDLVTGKSWSFFSNWVPKQNRPPMFTTDDHQSVPSDVLLRICAVRETFEESGVLIYADKSSLSNANLESPVSGINDLHPDPIDHNELQIWKKKLNNGEATFPEMCRELEIVPNIWCLYEWSNWLTPINMPKLHGKKRFDTAFYLCCLPEMPDHAIDEEEITHSEWLTPLSVLQQFHERHFWIAPPQYYELCRLASILDFQTLRKFAALRCTQGLSRWLPVRLHCADGTLSLLPGDDLYPEEPDIEGLHPSPSRPETMKALQESTENHHRFEVGDEAMWELNLLCSIPTKHGHLSPMPGQEPLRRYLPSQ